MLEVTNLQRDESSASTNSFAIEPTSAEDFFHRHHVSLSHIPTESADGSGLQIESESEHADRAGFSPKTADPGVPPAENYEHQGETTLLEEAITNEGRTPLIVDAEPPAMDWGASAPEFDLGEKPTDGQTEAAPQASIGEPAKLEHALEGAPALDWGDGEQDFFTQGPGPTEAFSTHPNASADKPAQEHDSAWDIALDDDFLPEHDGAEPDAPFVLDDDEGFLEDDPTLAHRDTAQPAEVGPSTHRYAPAGAPTELPSLERPRLWTAIHKLCSIGPKAGSQ